MRAWCGGTAKMMGRWRSGAPLALSPEHDDPELGSDTARRNDFLYPDEDPQGLKTPLGSHIRRMNPRDQFTHELVQVRASDPFSGHTLATAAVTDGHTVAHLYALINNMHSESALGVQCSGGLPGPVIFEVVFIRWSLPIEDARQIPVGCGWIVSQGGIPSARDDPPGQSEAILSELRTLLPGVTWP